MTLQELETILDTLTSRHPNIDETTLLTLLRSGGWEEKIVRDAITLFSLRKSTHIDKPRIALQEKPQLDLPEAPNGSHLLPVADTHQVIEDILANPSQYRDEEEDTYRDVSFVETKEEQAHNDTEISTEQLAQTSLESDSHSDVSENDVSLENKLQSKESDVENEETKDTQAIYNSENTQENVISPDAPSLIKEDISDNSKTDIIPHNLPLRPFESLPHVWSFSQYKKLFHGEEEEVEVKKQSNDAVDKKNIEVPQKPFSQNETKQNEHKDTGKIVFEKTPKSKSEESLLIIACVMLAIILLFLGYMYSNGRL